MINSNLDFNSDSFNFEESFLTKQSIKSIVESSHINFLIGAGTSSASFSPLGNIENTLTELANYEAKEAAKILVRGSVQKLFFEKVIKPNISIINKENDNNISLQSYKYFIKVLNRILLERESSILSKKVNIFTTNIDMLLELALEGLGVDYTDGFIGKIKPKFDHSDFGTLRSRIGSRYERQFQIPVFNLIKMHGSVSWQQEGSEEETTNIYFDHGLSLVKEVDNLLLKAEQYLIDVEDNPEPDNSSPEIYSVDRLIDDALKKLNEDEDVKDEVKFFMSQYNKLGIVNPDKQKFATTVLNETYYELIRRFSNELEKENSVLFVHGFSFRDEHIRNLVLRAARTNPTLYVLVFCYERSERDKYMILLPSDQIKNANIVFITPVKPEEGEKEQNIDLDNLVSNYLTPIIIDKIPQPERNNYSQPTPNGKR